jgi:hypothetical protein
MSSTAELNENKNNNDNDDHIVQCELCKLYVNCNTSNIFILQKVNDIFIEELVLCAECFDDKKEALQKEEWTSDDFTDDEI